MIEVDEYPSEDLLEVIKSFDWKDVEHVVEKLEMCWKYEGIKFNKSEHGWDLELHTSGWSGNEDIIEALSCSMFWFFHWQKSVRGGHYYFSNESQTYQ